MGIKILEGNSDNWGPSILKIPVIESTDFGWWLFTDSFEQYAKKHNTTFVMFQFPKGKPEEFKMIDGVNCTNKELYHLLQEIKERNYDC